MEDLWNGITFSCPHHPSPAPTTHRQHNYNHNHNHFRPTFTTAILQDFLARPFNSNLIAASSGSTDCLHRVPHTVLSLATTNVPPELQLGDSSSGYSPPHPPPHSCYSSESLPQFGKRPRLTESESDEMQQLQHHGNSDGRNKRMIKNRESAARSRARKQAYTNELELEIAQLKQENARLRMDQEKPNMAVLDQFRKKHRQLHRSMTAPF